MRIFAFVVVIASSAVSRADTATPTPTAACPQAADFEAKLAKAPKSVAAVRSQAVALDKLQVAAAKGDEGDACRVQLFDRYWSFYADVQVALAEKLAALPEAARAQRLKALAPLGWHYEDSEAGAYIADGSDWLLVSAGKRLPADYREYLRLRLADLGGGFSEDATLNISWSALRRRLRDWEDFDRAHPNFEHGEEIRGYLGVYLSTLMTGMDNTPAFNRDTGRLEPELRVELEAYAADPHARNRTIVREYLALLKKSKLAWSDDIAEFVAVHDASMLGSEPPRN